MNLNKNISGWYPELKARVEKLKACGVTASAMA